jgi:hypothetical protein
VVERPSKGGKIMFRKTFSQKIARVFEVVGYLFLVPAILSLIYPFLVAVASLFTLQIHFLMMSLIPFLIFGLGLALLVGYFKHSRGTLSEEKIIPLWFGTFFYNALPLLPIFYQILANPFDYQNFNFQERLPLFSLFCIFLVLWWAAAVLLSIGAIFSEFRENQLYK